MIIPILLPTLTRKHTCLTVVVLRLIRVNGVRFGYSAKCKVLALDRWSIKKGNIFMSSSFTRHRPTDINVNIWIEQGSI